jgi:predicted AAA+ superfamily ATPase
MMISDDDTFVYLDLERDVDLNKLNDPELFFRNNLEKNICIDEVQYRPNLFTSLRPVIDQDRKNGRFLILGSASRDLIKQSAETLAGRIGYVELTPFYVPELKNAPDFTLNRLWLRGGFPDSYLQRSDRSSFIWRENFVRTFIERDIPQLGTNIPALTSRRLLTMCAHYQGQLQNSSKLGESLGSSYHTIQKYLDLLEQLFIIRSLRPYYPNIKKRIVKSPKLYIRDSGILHYLIGIENYNDLLGHPVFGASWEGFCIENIVTQYADWHAYFYRTSSGNEIDLILERGNEKIAIEFKATSAPKIGKGIYQAIDDLGIENLWIVAPVEENYALNERVNISTLSNFLQQF